MSGEKVYGQRRDERFSSMPTLFVPILKSVLELELVQRYKDKTEKASLFIN